MCRQFFFVPLVSMVVGLAIFAQDADPSTGTPILKKGMLGPGVEYGLNQKRHLLTLLEVRKELELTPQQLSKLSEATQEAAKGDAARGKAQGERLAAARAQGDTETLEAMREESRAWLLALTWDDEIPFLRALDRSQRARLEQIQLQLDGPLGLSRPEVQKRLNFSPEQTEWIGQILDRTWNEWTAASMVAPGVISKQRLSKEDREALLKSKASKSKIDTARNAVIAARGATMRAVARVLTKRQLETYKRMLGPPFDYDRLRPGYVPGKDEPARTVAPVESTGDRRAVPD